MTTKRIMRWVIVLFLLAALPVMTAVMAQGQEPRAPEAPATWNVYESEPNNTLATADSVSLNDVIGGFVECDPGPYVGMDYFRFHMAKNGFVLIEADWDTIGSEGLDPDITLWDSTGTYLFHVENGEPEWNESVLFYSLDPGDYYVQILDYDNYPDPCGTALTYELLISSPLLISASAANLGNGYVDGIPFKSGDILAHSDLNNGTQRWTMLFDASDVGITVNVTNIAAGGDETLLLTLGANQVLQGVGTVTPWDIVIFDPGWYGLDTGGIFRMGLDGSEHQLTTSGEKLDAIEGFTKGIESDPLYRGCFGFPVSTVGVATVNGVFGATKQDDEDVFCKVYNPDYGGWQHWEWFFDVDGKFDAPTSEPAPGSVTGLAGEDVYAMAYNDTSEKMYLTILGNGKIAGHNVTQKDIFAINYPAYTWGGYVWRGAQHGWNYNIDAIELNGW